AAPAMTTSQSGARSETATAPAARPATRASSTSERPLATASVTTSAARIAGATISSNSCTRDGRRRRATPTGPAGCSPTVPGPAAAAEQDRTLEARGAAAGERPRLVDDELRLREPPCDRAAEPVREADPDRGIARVQEQRRHHGRRDAAAGSEHGDRSDLGR